MEYIDGYAIDDKEHLLEDGYDMNEIGINMWIISSNRSWTTAFFMRICTREM